MGSRSVIEPRFIVITNHICSWVSTLANSTNVYYVELTPVTNPHTVDEMVRERQICFNGIARGYDGI